MTAHKLAPPDAGFARPAAVAGRCGGERAGRVGARACGRTAVAAGPGRRARGAAVRAAAGDRAGAVPPRCGSGSTRSVADAQSGDHGHGFCRRSPMRSASFRTRLRPSLRSWRRRTRGRAQPAASPESVTNGIHAPDSAPFDSSAGARYEARRRGRRGLVRHSGGGTAGPRRLADDAPGAYAPVKRPERLNEERENRVYLPGVELPRELRIEPVDAGLATRRLRLSRRPLDRS